MAAWFKVSFNELLWPLYLSNTFYYILVQLDWPVIYPPSSPDSLSLVVDGGMYRPCFPKAVFASLCFV